jgi:hypothetical protein
MRDDALILREPLLAVDAVPVAYGVERIEKDLGMNEARWAGRMGAEMEAVERPSGHSIEGPGGQVHRQGEAPLGARGLRGRLGTLGPPSAKHHPPSQILSARDAVDPPLGERPVNASGPRENRALRTVRHVRNRRP